MCEDRYTSLADAAADAMADAIVAEFFELMSVAAEIALVLEDNGIDVDPEEIAATLIEWATEPA
jgi:hypothetical protein